MKNILLMCTLLALSKSQEVNSIIAISSNIKKLISMPVDSSSTLNRLYKNIKILPSINDYAFSYKYFYDQKSKIVKVECMRRVDNNTLEYYIELKDTKSVFNRNTFSVGDDYKYITSYFVLDGIKLSLNKVHALNSENDFLTQISNIWSNDRTAPTIKLYKTGKKKIFLIKGIDSYCNGHNCKDYVVYVLQKENDKGSINAVHFEGTNNPYDFDNLKLFYGLDVVNPSIMVPKNSRPVSSRLNVNIYKIYFDSIKR